MPGTGGIATESARRSVAGDAPASGRRPSADRLWYAVPVLVGAMLIVAAAVSQPYNQNELQQLEPYGSDSYDEIVGGTRQPPLDPLLGSLVQHLLGEGQLRQRLVPALAGIGTLVVLALLFRRSGLRRAGAGALLLVATQPVMVQYSAYARPYALPVFLSLVFVWAAQAWLAGRGPGWLALTALAACALPASRVPEPNAFLAVSALTLGWLSVRRHRPWSRTGPLIATAVGAIALVGYPLYRDLASTSGPPFDPSPEGIVQRLGAGVDELVERILPGLGEWFPWWPVTLAIVVLALVLPTARAHALGEWGWAWWPLLAAPVVFLLAYHLANPVSFELRPYRDRYAYFLVPALALLVGSLAAVAADRGTARRVRVGLLGLLAVSFATQLPATARVLTQNTAPDFVAAAQLVADELPPDGVVLYATPALFDLWRQPFESLQLDQVDGGAVPTVVDTRQVAGDPALVPRSGPVWLLVMAGECASSAYCDKPTVAWDGEVPGWRSVARVDRFELFAPRIRRGDSGGAVHALTSFARAVGPDYGFREILAAATLREADGDPAAARTLLRDAYAAMDPGRRESYRLKALRAGPDPFG